MKQPFLWFLLSGFKWYRQRCGGKWECWWLDVPVVSDLWFKVEDWSIGRRPDVLCRGTPIREAYEKGMAC